MTTPQPIDFSRLPPEAIADLQRTLTDYPELQSPEITKILGSVGTLLGKQKQKLLNKHLPLLAAALLTPEVVEKDGPLAWVKRFYPQTFTRDFTKYQREFWEWGWEIQPDISYRPRVECAPRGAGKSASAETWIVQILARHRRKAIGYVSGSDDKANKHFAGVKRKLENPELLRVYPHLKPQVQKYRNAFNSWSQDRLVTEAGQVIIPITLQGSNRGFKSEDDTRFDLIVLDDIDSLGESPDVIAKNLDLLKSEILLAGYAYTLIAVFQNLIHRDSIVTQIMDHRADMLSDRDFRGPYPLMKWYDAEKVDMPDGGKKWTITAGEPYDEALPREYCELVLGQVGKDLFDRECQQEVNKVAEDKDFREWDELFHIITRSEMERGFENVRLRDANGFYIPNRWHVGRGMDWGTTRSHPAVTAYVTRPDKTCPFSDDHFVMSEVVMPKFPFDPSLASEVVSPGRIAHAIKVVEKSFRIQSSQIEQSKMSHEASAAKNTLLLDLPPELTLFFSKWKAAKGSGVPQIQNMLEIDRTKPHPFRRYPEGTILKRKDGSTENVGGRPLMGRPRIYFVVEDGQGELYLDGDGKVRVRGAIDSNGLARCRYEMPLYSHRNAGKKKIDDDFVDALRGLMSTFGVQADALTDEEELVAATPEQYRPENAYAGGYSPEREMSVNYQLALAKQRVQTTRIVTFDEFNRPIGQESDELAESLW
jgi:hypothetical protein